MEVSVQAQEEAKEAELSRKELGLQEGVENLKALIQVTWQLLKLPHSPHGPLLCVYSWERIPIFFFLLRHNYT